MSQAPLLHPPRRLGLPLHRQVYVVLRNAIDRGEPAPGEPLPPEEELARLFDVSRATVRTALAALEADGLIDRQQGRGTFVSGGVTVEAVGASMADLIAHMQDVGSRTEVTVVALDYGPLPLTVQARFGSREEGTFQRAVRVRTFEGKPLFHITTYVPEAIGRTYTVADLERTPLYDLLRRAQVELYSGTQVVTAAAAEPEVARFLGLAVGDPILVVRRAYVDRDGELVEYVEMLASPAAFELHTSLDPVEDIG